jgi:phosphoribosyl-dephospho-CoA transferase
MFARHNQVWLSAHGWQQALAAAPKDCHDAIDMWRQADWPAIVRRTDPEALAHQVCAGIALPPHPADSLKKRIALRVCASAIKEVRPPLPVGAVIASAPHAWRAHLAALGLAAASQGLTIKVFGSVALQAVTGQSYVTAASDIDLLFYPTSWTQVSQGVDLLSLYASRLPLDGEIVFPPGDAVAWKEFVGALGSPNPCRVLVKSQRTVSLSTPTALLAMLKDDACVR